MLLKVAGRDFPGDLVAKIYHSQSRGPSLIPSQVIRSHMLQLKIPHAPTKIEHPHSQIN